MKRMRILFGTSQAQLLVVLAAVLVAAGAIAASGASFTAQSANASNVFSTGSVITSNTPTGMSTTISQMVPGDYHSGTVVIKNTGDVSGHFYLEPVVITGDTKGLAAQLQLDIKDGATSVYTGSLAGLTQKDLGTWAVNDTHTYTIKVSMPDQGRDGAGVGLDNAFMGATTTAAFKWTAVSLPGGSR